MIRPFAIPLRFRFIQLTLVWLTALCLTLHAQAPDDRVNLRFSACALAINGELSEVHLPLAKAAGAKATEWLKVPLNEITVGQPLAYHGSSKLTFFAKQVEGEKPVATVTVAATAKSILLVFLPDSATAGYKVIQVNDADFAFGSYYLQNLSPHAIAIDLAGRKQILPPGAKAIMAVPAAEDQQVKIHASINNTARLIKSTSWRLDADQRELVFFYQPPGSATVLSKHLMSNKVATPVEQ